MLPARMRRGMLDSQLVTGVRLAQVRYQIYRDEQPHVPVEAQVVCSMRQVQTTV